MIAQLAAFLIGAAGLRAHWAVMALIMASSQCHGVPLAGGMERPGDDYKRTNNMRLEPRDKLFGGQVSRLQVAELVAAAVSNPDLAENKVCKICSLL